MSGSLKTILRGSTSRVNLPNAQSNDCGRSPTNDGNGNVAICALAGIHASVLNVQVLEDEQNKTLS